jgi:hypothetical protein
MRGYRENGDIVREGGDSRDCEPRRIGDHRFIMGEGVGTREASWREGGRWRQACAKRTREGHGTDMVFSLSSET